MGHDLATPPPSGLSTASSRDCAARWSGCSAVHPFLVATDFSALAVGLHPDKHDPGVQLLRARAGASFEVAGESPALRYRGAALRAEQSRPFVRAL